MSEQATTIHNPRLANPAANTARPAAAALSEIDRIIEKRSVLSHPFYQAWQRGELSREALQDYAAQYYHHVEAFPTYLSALHSRTADAATRQLILENLIDEERGAVNHPELWLRFAEGVGADRGEITQSEARPRTRHLVATFRKHVSSERTAAGLAALYAYESQIPAVSLSKIDGLRTHYGVSNPDSLAYFVVHAEADVKHSAEERAALARHIAGEDDAAEAVCAADEVTEALWQLLSCIGERHGIACQKL